MTRNPPPPLAPPHHQPPGAAGAGRRGTRRPSWPPPAGAAAPPAAAVRGRAGGPPPGRPPPQQQQPQPQQPQPSLLPPRRRGNPPSIDPSSASPRTTTSPATTTPSASPAAAGVVVVTSSIEGSSAGGAAVPLVMTPPLSSIRASGASLDAASHRTPGESAAGVGGGGGGGRSSSSSGGGGGGRTLGDSGRTSKSTTAPLFKRPPPRHPTPGSGGIGIGMSTLLRHVAIAGANGAPSLSRSLPTTPTHRPAAASSASSSIRESLASAAANHSADAPATPTATSRSRSRSPSPFRFKLPPASPTSSSTSPRGGSAAPSSPAQSSMLRLPDQQEVPPSTSSWMRSPRSLSAATTTMGAATAARQLLHAPDLSLSRAETTTTTSAALDDDATVGASPAAGSQRPPESSTTSHDDGELPRGWVELVDPSSGAPYYYHEQEQRTTWERPVVVATPVPGGSSPDGVRETGDAATEEEAVASAPAAALGVERAAPEPLAAAAAAAAAAGMVADDSAAAPEPYLPPDEGDAAAAAAEPWILVEGADVGGCTATAEPTSPPDGAVVPAPSPSVDVDVDDDDHASRTTGAAPSLPDGWQECHDASSGRTYYFHEDTNVTQWDRPVSASGDRGSEEARTTYEGAATGARRTVVDDTILGGNETVNSLSAEGAATGARRTVVDDTILGGNETVNPQESTLPETTESPLPPTSPPGRTSSTPQAARSAVGIEHDDGRWHNDENQAPSAGLPPLSSLMSEPTIATPFVPLGSTVATPSYLPAGWEELIDDASGRVYFYHAEDGATTWERPHDERPEAIRDVPESMASPFTSEDAPNLVPQGSGVESPGKHEGVAVEPHGTIVSGNGADDSPGSRGAPVASLAGLTPVETADALPEGWVEAVDEGSGRVYYCNVHDNTTRWDRPAASNPEVQAHQEGMDSSIDPTTSTGEMTATTSAVNESLPEGWQELRDTTSGRVYYYHEVDGDTTWEKPLGAAPTTAATTVDIRELRESPELAPTESEGALPEAFEAESNNREDSRAAGGWERTSSESSEVQTAASSGLLSPSDVVTAESTDSGRHELAEPLHAPLPEGWEELVDEATGSAYYYNSVDGTSSWSRPGSEVATALSAEGPADGVSLELAKQDPSVGDERGGVEIPIQHDRDWQEEQIDGIVTSNENESLGGEASKDWREETYPSADSASPSSDAGEPSSADSLVVPDEAAASSSLPGSVVLPVGWEEVVDEDSGAVYYYNAETDTASWDVPGFPEHIAPENYHEVDKQDETPELHVESEPEAHQPSAQSLTESDDLPAGWEELVDESTGQVYYFCEESDLSQWERPRNASLPSPPDAVSFDDVDIPMSTSAEPESAPEQTASESTALPAGWVEMTDEASGLPFYTSDDGTRTWDRPVQVGLSERPGVPTQIPLQSTSTLEPMDMPPEWTEATDDTSPGHDDVKPVASEPQSAGGTHMEDAPASSLPPGWVKFNDPTTGRTYFYNEDTNDTSWDRPSVTLGSLDDLMLPEGWEEVIDESTGQTYYFNAGTGESSWDRPASSSSANTIAKGAETETARRPAHAIAVFGFGGRLCLIRSGSPIAVIRRTGTIITGSAVLDSESAKMEANICGPLRAADINSASTYISQRSAKFQDQRALLWQMIAIAVKSKGKLRSDRPVDDSQSPESAVARLLLGLPQGRDHNGGEYMFQGSGSGPTDARDADLRSTFRLLVEGKQEDAAREAAQNGCFALSLVLASMCGPRVFDQAIANYAHAELVTGSPLFTATVLFSGQVKPSRALWGTDLERLRSFWQNHLLAILSVRSKGWDLFAVSLGDALTSIGESEAAHVCYLVCGCPLASPTRNDFRYTLLGLDAASTDPMLSSDNAVAAYEATEAYEWARLQGSSSGSIDCLQPIKLAYALLLADLGLETAAAKYVKELKSAFRSNVASDRGTPREPPSYAILTGDKKSLLAAVAAFESRLSKGATTDGRDGTFDTSTLRQIGKHHVATAPHKNFYENGTPTLARDMPSTNGSKATAPFAPSTLFVSSADVVSKPRHIAVAADPSPSPCPPRANSPEARHAAPQPSASTPKPVGGDVASSFQTPSVSKPPEDDSSAKPKSAPMSAPANLQQSSSTPASSGKKKGFFSFGLRNTFTKLLNPNATQADLGEGMQAYYDEKLKVWVFPGEDPAEVAKPIGPPPTTPQAAPGPSTTTSPAAPAAASSNDPLAALMALPNRAPSNFQSKSKSAGAAPSIGTSRVPLPGMIMLPPGAAVSGASTSTNVPPPFAVFTPGPSATAAS